MIVSKWVRRFGCVAILGIFGAPIFACDEILPPERCTDIPPGGCPRSHGVACEDPTCEAVYLCREGNVWELEQKCPPRDPSDAAILPTDASDAEAEAAPSFDASIDAPPGANGGPGCGALQAPDCPLGLALACTNDCCGCEDLFVCENGGWSFWGVCPAGGF